MRVVRLARRAARTNVRVKWTTVRTDLRTKADTLTELDWLPATSFSGQGSSALAGSLNPTRPFFMRFGGSSPERSPLCRLPAGALLTMHPSAEPGGLIGGRLQLCDHPPGPHPAMSPMRWCGARLLNPWNGLGIAIMGVPRGPLRWPTWRQAVWPGAAIRQHRGGAAITAVAGSIVLIRSGLFHSGRIIS